MSTRFRDIEFPPTFKYSSDSDNIPLEFYEEVFPVSKKIDLLLGYFSSNAIKILSKSIAEFIMNGGEMRIITNHVLTVKDKENLIDNTDLNDEDKVIDIFSDLGKLEKELSDYGKHFFDCLKYLLKKGRLSILPVKFNGVDLAHCKKMILFDGEDYISTDGSINFTLSALTKNSESFEVNAPWKGEIFDHRTQMEKENFNCIFSKQHPQYEYIDSKKIETVIYSVGNNKEEKDLLEDSLKLEKSTFGEKVKAILAKKSERFHSHIKSIKKDLGEPYFPFDKPREYQKDAYMNWVKNDRKGLFAMATGTGKTITSLNCIVEDYSINKFYKFIVLVPTRALLSQWEKEVRKKFNFTDVYLSGTKSFYEELPFILREDDNFAIIATYAAFKGDRFQTILNDFKEKEEITLIADEAHTMGSSVFRKILPNLKDIKYRIGLSATPSRYFDEIGEKEVFDFFNIEIIDGLPNYTTTFTISEAIHAKPTPFLCPYNYYPKFVDLQADEMELYKKYTVRLMKFIDHNGVLKKCVEVENLLKLRKDVIKKAKLKKEKLVEIISEIGSDNFKFAFVYVPEGKDIDYGEEDIDWTSESDDDKNIIINYTKAVNEAFNYKIGTRHFTGATKDRDNILKDFEQGRTDTLFAMKCLDEGVDVPRTEIAIFCSSTGNPRQYVQRRGRVLRLHENKEIATIYDMIVIPTIEDLKKEGGKEFACEKNLVKGEISRLIAFAKDSNNQDDVLYDSELIYICDFFEINLDELIN